MIKKIIKQGFFALPLPSFVELYVKDDRALFANILANPGHVLHGFLLPVHVGLSQYSLRPRPHNRAISRYDLLTRKEFIIGCFTLINMCYSFTTNYYYFYV